MKARTIALLAAALSIVTSSAVLAATYVVPTDRQLVLRSDAIVIARAIHSGPSLNEYGAIVTTTEFTVESVLKGKIKSLSSLHLNEPGGRIGEKATMIPGSPRFSDGERYLLFVTHVGNSFTTWGLGLGKFDFTADAKGRPIVVRGADDGEEIFGFDESHSNGLHVERARLEEPFLRFIRDIVRGEEPKPIDYFVLQPQATTPHRTASDSTPRLKTQANALRADYLFDGPFRWQNASQTIVVCCSATGSQPNFDGPGGVQDALANWNGGGGNVHYTYGGNDPAATHGLAGFGSGTPDGKNAVLFNDPNGDFAAGGFPAGVVGLGGISAAIGTYTLGGETFNDTREVDVVIAKSSTFPNGLNQATFVGLVTHGVGHTLGFRHSDQTSADNPTIACTAPLPCAGVGQAIMASTVAFNLSTLGAWDRDAVSTVYGAGPVCNAPVITTQPQSSSITQGQSASLSAIATGTNLTYQWYSGVAGNTTTPVGTGPSITVSPSTTTSYWVRVTSVCGANPTVDSGTVTVTVNPAICNAPAITAQPVSRGILQGQATTLAVTATGTNLTYQWFTGTTGDTSSGVIATGSSITVSPSVTTSYWVRVTSACGSNPAVDSATATVTVTAPVCVPPAFLFDPQSQSILAGQTATLSVGVQGSSPTITWYRGFRGDTSNPVGSGNSFTTPPLSATTTFFARANGCGQSVDSANATVTVGPCDPPAIISVTASPSSVTPTANTSTLSVAATGTSLTYQWFIGQSGNSSTPLPGGNSPSVVVNPTVTTAYWVQVTSGCGAGVLNSATVTVTVGTCVAPAITSQPADATSGGSSATKLTVVASGTAPLHYQFFQGSNINDRSQPVGGDSSIFTLPALSGRTSFYVVITNACGTATSRVATVSVVRRHAAKH